jgi:hypothetical protein
MSGTYIVFGFLIIVVLMLIADYKSGVLMGSASSGDTKENFYGGYGRGYGRYGNYYPYNYGYYPYNYGYYPYNYGYNPFWWWY